MNKAFEFVEDFEFSTDSYTFDTLKVVRSVETGQLYYAEDSGCSCPVPFDGCAFPQDYTPIKRGESWRAFVAHFENRAQGFPAKERADFIEKIKSALTVKPAALRSPSDARSGGEGV